MSTKTLLASAARTATTATSDQLDPHAEGVHVIINVTAVSGTTPTLTPTIEGKDPVSGNYYTVLAGAAISTVSTVVLRVGPGITVAANLSAADYLPDTWRVNCVVGGTTPSFTFSIGAVLAE